MPPKCHILPDVLIENKAVGTKHTLCIATNLPSSTKLRKYPDTWKPPCFTPFSPINLWSLKFELQHILQGTLWKAVVDAEWGVLYSWCTEICSHYSAGDDYLSVCCCPLRGYDNLFSSSYSALYQEQKLSFLYKLLVGWCNSVKLRAVVSGNNFTSPGSHVSSSGLRKSLCVKQLSVVSSTATSLQLCCTEWQ